MSEPLSSHEIEDVLSSIRRLVSEELRPGAAAPVPAEDGGKLLLTPALRVVETPAAEAVAEPAGDEDYDDAGPNGDDALPTAAVEEGELLWAATGEGEGTADDAPHAGHWTAETAPQVVWMDEEQSGWAEEEPAVFVTPRRAAPLADEPLARAWAERAEAEVRAELQDAAPAAAPVAPPSIAADADPADATPGLFDQDEPLIDEEALRDIVREIIREELAGTLGERITRNVRKLVRVEVNRALTARDFG